jgi:hypothetical protein
MVVVIIVKYLVVVEVEARPVDIARRDARA